MDQCAWCKKENIDVRERSGHHEPLCERCSYDYRFGFKQGMIPGKVSDLYPDEKRTIRRARRNIERFWEATLIVDGEVLKEVLSGRAKTVSRAAAAVLIVGFLGIPFLFGIADAVNDSAWGLVYVAAYIFLGIFAHERIVQRLKQWQLKRKAREAGYGGI